eukprot:122877-Rhodomonas_salina.3
MMHTSGTKVYRACAVLPGGIKHRKALFWRRSTSWTPRPSNSPTLSSRAYLPYPPYLPYLSDLLRPARISLYAQYKPLCTYCSIQPICIALRARYGNSGTEVGVWRG